MLEQLISEHRVAMSIARELARTPPGEDRDAWLRDLSDLMAEHLASEEQFVGPLLDQYPREGIGPPLDLRATALGSALVAVRATGGEGFGVASSALVEALQTHIAWVEYDVLPALVVPTWEGQLAGGQSPDVRQQTADDVARDRPAPQEPPFWER